MPFHCDMIHMLQKICKNWHALNELGDFTWSFSESSTNSLTTPMKMEVNTELNTPIKMETDGVSQMRDLNTPPPNTSGATTTNLSNTSGMPLQSLPPVKSMSEKNMKLLSVPSANSNTDQTLGKSSSCRSDLFLIFFPFALCKISFLICLESK